VVKRIKRIEADLELVVFVEGHLEILVERHIKVLNARSIEHVALCVSDEAVGRLLPGRWVHPLVTGIAAGPAVRLEKTLPGDVVRPRSKGSTGNGIGAGIVVAVSHVVRAAGLECT